MLLTDEMRRHAGLPSREEAKKPTYDQAKDAIMGHLASKGWEVKKDLKIPHATSPNGEHRLWFKGQSVHHSQGGNAKDFHSARSMGFGQYGMKDLRDTSPEEFHDHLKKHYLKEDQSKCDGGKQWNDTRGRCERLGGAVEHDHEFAKKASLYAPAGAKASMHRQALELHNKAAKTAEAEGFNELAKHHKEQAQFHQQHAGQ